MLALTSIAHVPAAGGEPHATGGRLVFVVIFFTFVLTVIASSILKGRNR